MPRKSLQTATRMALAARLADDEVKLVDRLTVDAPKTAVVARMLGALGLGEQTVLLAADTHDANVWKSARNIAGVSVSPVAELNAWSILRPKSIVMTTAAIDAFRAGAKAKAGGAAKDGGKPKAGGKKAAATALKPAARRSAKKEA
jgi:large subunit ribosomal protein L4